MSVRVDQSWEETCDLRYDHVIALLYQQRATFLMVYPPPPRTNIGRPNDLTYFTQSLVSENRWIDERWMDKRKIIGQTPFETNEKASESTVKCCIYSILQLFHRNNAQRRIKSVYPQHTESIYS